MFLIEYIEYKKVVYFSRVVVLRIELNYDINKFYVDQCNKGH